jgi:hypothetical protein
VRVGRRRWSVGTQGYPGGGGRGPPFGAGEAL